MLMELASTLQAPYWPTSSLPSEGLSFYPAAQSPCTLPCFYSCEGGPLPPDLASSSPQCDDGAAAAGRGSYLNLLDQQSCSPDRSSFLLPDDDDADNHFLPLTAGAPGLAALLPHTSPALHPFSSLFTAAPPPAWATSYHLAAPPTACASFAAYEHLSLLAPDSPSADSCTAKYQKALYCLERVDDETSPLDPLHRTAPSTLLLPGAGGVDDGAHAELSCLLHLHHPHRAAFKAEPACSSGLESAPRSWCGGRSSALGSSGAPPALRSAAAAAAAGGSASSGRMLTTPPPSRCPSPTLGALSLPALDAALQVPESLLLLQGSAFCSGLGLGAAEGGEEGGGAPGASTASAAVVDEEGGEDSSDEASPLPPAKTFHHKGGGPCDHCSATESPQWRRGPAAKPCLCNACGTRFRRTSCLGPPCSMAAAKAKAAGGMAAPSASKKKGSKRAATAEAAPLAAAPSRAPKARRCK